MPTRFFALSVRKTLPSGKRGRKLLPHSRREVGAAAAPSRGAGSREVTPALWVVSLPCAEGARAGTVSSLSRGGLRSPK